MFRGVLCGLGLLQLIVLLPLNIYCGVHGYAMNYGFAIVNVIFGIWALLMAQEDY